VKESEAKIIELQLQLIKLLEAKIAEIQSKINEILGR